MPELNPSALLVFLTYPCRYQDKFCLDLDSKGQPPINCLLILRDKVRDQASNPLLVDYFASIGSVLHPLVDTLRVTLSRCSFYRHLTSAASLAP